MVLMCYERGATAIVAVAIAAAAATFATNNNRRYVSVLFLLALESAIFINNFVVIINGQLAVAL